MKKAKYTTPEFHLIPDFERQPLFSMSDRQLESYIGICTRRKYYASSNYVLRKIGDSALIIPAGVGIDPSLENAILTPSRTAAFLWNIFQKPITLSEAVQQCVEHFSGPSEQIEIDVSRFVWALLTKKMLKKEENK